MPEQAVLQGCPHSMPRLRTSMMLRAALLVVSSQLGYMVSRCMREVTLLQRLV